MNKDFPEEEGIRRRFLATYAKLKEKYTDLMDTNLATWLGFKNRNLVRELATGKKKIDLYLILSIKKAFPEVDTQYILFADDFPKVVIPSKARTTLAGKAGRKKQEVTKYPYYPRKKKSQNQPVARLAL